MRTHHGKIVVAEVDGAHVDVRHKSERRKLRLCMGERLLVAGEACVKYDAGMARCHDVDMRDLVRLAVCIDLGCGRNRPFNRDEIFVLARSRQSIEDRITAAEWMIDAAVRGSPDAEALTAYLVQTECYQLIRFVLSQGVDTSIALLAQRYGLSLAHFHRICKRMLGRSLKTELRILRAARSLLDYPGRACSFTRLAADNGYASLSHFCSEIKCLIGVPPGAVYQAIAPGPP